MWILNRWSLFLRPNQIKSANHKTCIQNGNTQRSPVTLKMRQSLRNWYGRVKVIWGYRCTKCLRFCFHGVRATLKVCVKKRNLPISIKGPPKLMKNCNAGGRLANFESCPLNCHALNSPRPPPYPPPPAPPMSSQRQRFCQVRNPNYCPEKYTYQNHRKINIPKPQKNVHTETTEKYTYQNHRKADGCVVLSMYATNTQ